MIAFVSVDDVVYFGFVLFFVFLALVASFCLGWWTSRKTIYRCPYTKCPLRRGTDLHWETKEKVLRFLFNFHEYDNRMFDINCAAVCRDTGHIFPDALTWYHGLKVDWNFLQKRYPGNYVSWGSLTEEQKLIIQSKHKSLDGFQTDFSSPLPSPRFGKPEYIHAKPGPLYVDIDTSVLVGWQCVPDTDLEVLIVQKPIERGGNE